MTASSNQAEQFQKLFIGNQNGYGLLKNGEHYILRLPEKKYDTFDSLFLLLKESKTEDLLVIEYEVKSGDNLSKIAARYKIKIQDITSMNNISSKKYLQPGQKLQIPTRGYNEYMQSLLSSNKSKKINNATK